MWHYRRRAAQAPTSTAKADKPRRRAELGWALTLALGLTLAFDAAGAEAETARSAVALAAARVVLRSAGATPNVWIVNGSDVASVARGVKCQQCHALSPQLSPLTLVAPHGGQPEDVPVPRGGAGGPHLELGGGRADCGVLAGSTGELCLAAEGEDKRIGVARDTRVLALRWRGRVSQSRPVIDATTRSGD